MYWSFCVPGVLVSKAPGEFYYLNEAGLIDFRCGTTGQWTTGEKVPWEMCETWMILLMVQKIWRSPVEVGRLSTIIYRVFVHARWFQQYQQKMITWGFIFFAQIGLIKVNWIPFCQCVSMNQADRGFMMEKTIYIYVYIYIRHACP